MRFPILRFLVPVAALALALGMTISARAEASRLLRSAVDGEVRALVIGIDAYQHVRQLKGAVADALDIDGALRRGRVADITTLIDAKADRASVIAAINRLADRSGPHDLVILSLAGHGAQEPERLKGSQPDGLENVFLLAGFDSSAAGSRERILGAEFYHFIKEFEARGAHVIFVADTCFGGGLTRDIDPRWEEMSFRQVPSYRLTSDLLQPVTTAADELATDTDFDRTVFLAAVDRRTKAPEVQIPGIPGLRGALSYSVARALEGNVAAHDDGSTTLQDFFTYLRQDVYQLSNQRQNIVTTAPPGENPGTDIVFRSVVVGNSAAPVPQPGNNPIKIAVVDDKSERFAGLMQRESPFKVVSMRDDPDLIWDPGSRDVVYEGDPVATDIEPSDLPSVIDRATAVGELKRFATREPQVVEIAPNNSRHKEGSKVVVELADVAQRALILVNIAGDGTVQVLYPGGTVPTSAFDYPVRVGRPFGGDQVVAVTSPTRITGLEQAVQALDGLRKPVELVRLIKKFAAANVRVGSTGIFTAP